MNESIMKTKTLWDLMIPQIKKEIIKQCDNDIPAQNLKKRLQSMKDYHSMTWGDIIDVNLYGNTVKLLTPTDFIKL